MGKLFTRKDALIMLILALAVAAAFALSAWLAPEPVWVVVYLNGEEYARAPLGEARTIVVEQADGSRNEVVIDGDGVHMGFSTCKNQLCVNRGEITGGDDTALSHWIICLPNGVSVELTEGGE